MAKVKLHWTPWEYGNKFPQWVSPGEWMSLTIKIPGMAKPVVATGVWRNETGVWVDVISGMALPGIITAYAPMVEGYTPPHPQAEVGQFRESESGIKVQIMSIPPDRTKCDVKVEFSPTFIYRMWVSIDTVEQWKVVDR